MKLTVMLDFGVGSLVKVGTFSDLARDTAFDCGTADDALASLRAAGFRAFSDFKREH